ncbi:Sialate O-acetylesterase [Candidatus Sulfopaludibacter sp. SbA6]|nr:Sialate O-acetylesterase [Candidatus Sulfopaludibacter sp. SbA6]
MRKLISFLLTAFVLQAAVKLPAVISDHMVLQQGMPVRVWGTADPGETVKVDFQGQSVSVKAAENGKWTAWLRPLIAAGPLEMTINSETIHDVLVGEVWLGSGQSNMEFRLATAVNHDEEIARADYPMIHLFQVKRAVADQPLEDVTGSWQVCSPASVKGFSAVEYFFGRHLLQNLHLPMGLIESDWGGTPAQSWASRQAMESDPALKFVLDEWDSVLARYPAAKERYDQQLEAWNKAAAEAKAQGKTPPNRPNPPAGPGHQNTPGGLYNAMIAPLVPYGIRGAIWYQGESNATEAHAYKYRRLFGAMIEDWRNRWDEGDFPFLFVQLANYKTNGWWPVLRESQTETLRLANTGMAVIVDIGESKDIHPKNKQDVGLRLALAARALTYHQPIEYSGPVFQSAAPEGAAMRVYFTHADGLQGAGGSAVKGFEVAGADGKYVEAEARVEGGTVVVSSAQVSAPSTVRYAWADDPACNLVNQVGLPAGPFRSDQPRYGQ